LQRSHMSVRNFKLDSQIRAGNRRGESSLGLDDSHVVVAQEASSPGLRAIPGRQRCRGSTLRR
jgi:hypothetical protein